VLESLAPVLKRHRKYRDAHIGPGKAANAGGVATSGLEMTQNNVWWLRDHQKKPESFLQGRDEGRKCILEGHFPPGILEQFQGMLDYFGESPHIVRSSSILEDARGNAFSGKYESVFVANRGSREKRKQALLEAVRRVYASVLDEEALVFIRP